MKKVLLRALSFTLLSCILLATPCFAAVPKSNDIVTLMQEVKIDISSESVCLMEASTGEILYEQNPDERLEPASVTKIMSVLLMMESIENGTLKLTDTVCASKKASEMGGSQIWLEYGEEFTVDEMLKAIMVVSANDCTVAMAEHIAGSEDAFVAQMNIRARELGMENTNFANSTGLPCENHYTSAKDIALMTRELLKHEHIFTYTTIWMDSLRGGEMGLTNTNKLIRFYNGANGMKTGFTDSALYCMSATAKRDGMQLIAVTMKAKSSDERFEDAKKLLDYGFANFSIYEVPETKIDDIKVLGGKKATVGAKYCKISALLGKGKDKLIETVINADESVCAPVTAGQKLGKVSFVLNGEEVASCDIIATENVEKISFMGIFAKIFKNLILFR